MELFEFCVFVAKKAEYWSKNVYIQCRKRINTAC